MRLDLPTGTVTLVFTDIEGSTKLLHELGADAYAEALAEHRRVVREAFARHGGVEVDTQGDAFFYAFRTPTEALRAAANAQEALASGPIRVRMGIHTGTPHLTDEGYVGGDVHKGARIAAAGHGGQVLLSKEAADLAAVPVTDLGEHRLKDFAKPVWIFQLGRDRFPPLKTISNTNLPHPASSFVGREREVTEVVALLRGGVRLLTLTGPGGSGKTRLAIEAAAELVPDYRNGVFWVGLAPIRDPALVTATVAQTLGAKDGLPDHIGEREMLLLLDNLEQVIEASPELTLLLEACPHLRLLVTSREVLRIRGEVEYPVPPLADPEAVELFCARARVEPDGTIGELCQALDNLPLAIELAAARASVLSPAQILERLSGRLHLLKGGRDADPRQRTLRAAIEWSHELLIPEEQRLFARLSVFRGGCTLEEAEEVAEADLDTLQSLVDKSLLRRRDDRFWMLETIRQYAMEQLEGSGEGADVRRRHGKRFLALAEEAGSHLGGRPKEWLDRLEQEHDNLRAALDFFEASSEGQLAQRLAGALWRFWYQRGYPQEGRRRLEAALAADQRPTAARANVLSGAAAMAHQVGDLGAAELRAGEAIESYERLGDGWGIAEARFTLGITAVEEGDLSRAKPLLEDTLQQFVAVGDEHYMMLVTRVLGLVYYELGDLERARALHEDNLRRSRATGNERMEAASLAALGTIDAGDANRTGEALAMLRASTRICVDLGLRLEVAWNLCRFALALAVGGRGERAVRLLGASEALHEEIGVRVTPWVGRMNGQTLGIIRTQLDEAQFSEAWEQGRKLTVDEAVALALGS